MGILTIMKLGVFAFSSLSLLFAFTWCVFHYDVVHAPMKSFHNEKMHLNVHNSRDQLMFQENLDDYEKAAQEESHQTMYIAEKVPNKLKYSNENNENHNIIPTQYYNDEAFERLIGELREQNIEGYEVMAKSDDLSIYRRPRGNVGLYEYKLYSVLPNATPDQISAVFLDNEYRVEWDQYVTELNTVQENSKGPNVIYFNVDFPWPLTNRDYVYARETRRQIRDDEEYITIVMHSVLRDGVPQREGAIRVGDYHQSLVMAKHGQHGTRMYIEYYDDPRGSIPSWLVNWAAKTGVPAFLNDLQRACGGLDAFLAKKKKSMLIVPLHTN